jgi:[ribosomal protein S5]-alanine N-acetyltransferase
VLLRRWERTDLACARAGKGYGPEEALAWIEGQWRRRHNGAGISFAIAAAGSGEALGCVSFNARPQPGTAPAGRPDGLLFEPQRGTVGIGYWVLPHARRRGLASHAVALVTRWAIAEAGIVRIEALVEPHNVASQRVVGRAGFSREGLLRDYLELGLDGDRTDVYVYSLLAGDTQRAGPGPEPLAQGLVEIGDQVVGRLDPDREPDEV